MTGGLALLIGVPLFIILVYKIETAWWVAPAILMLAGGFWLDQKRKDYGSVQAWWAARHDGDDEDNWGDDEDAGETPQNNLRPW